LATAYPDQPHLTVLPFVMRAIVVAVADQPQLNSTFDDDEGVLTTYGAVHVGIATRTVNGLLAIVGNVYGIAASLENVAKGLDQ
jgi:2-oxoisovalerate dehydrogenase E2 component (dihydrolipoyl transacylase)